MKILIIGGLGFVGSNLVKKLSKNLKNDIVVLDNLFTGNKKNRINYVNYIKGESVGIDFFLEEGGHKPDIIYHLGEYSRVMTSFKDIEKVVEYNSVGTLAVIEYCRKNKVRLIYAGSSTKFGDVESPYSFFKEHNTDIIENYGKWYKLDYAIAYFYNVYGPNQISKGKYATLIGILEENIKNGKPHKINKPGIQRRIFTHVNDVVEGLILIGENGKGEYCLGSKDSFSIYEVAKMFGGEIKMKGKKKGDRNYSGISLDRIEKLGWKAKRKLKDYIKNFHEQRKKTR